MSPRLFAAALFLVAVCAAGPALSQTVGLHTASQHLPRYEWQSNSNPGAYVRTADGWTVGAFRNTLRRPTVYAGRTWMDVIGPVDVMAAAATGYRVAPVVPLVMLSTELAPRSWPVVPRLSVGRGADSWVAHLSLEVTP